MAHGKPKLRQKIDTYSKVNLKKTKPYIDLYLKTLKENISNKINGGISDILAKKEVEKAFIKCSKNPYDNMWLFEYTAETFASVLIDFYTSNKNLTANHYFIKDNSLIDFFLSLDFKDLDINNQLFNRPEILKNEKIQICVNDNFEEHGIATTSIFVLHTKKLEHSLIIRLNYSIFDNIEVDNFRIEGLYGNIVIPLYLSSDNNISLLFESGGSDTEDRDQLNYFYKIMLGFFCYISTFKDNVKEGAPNDAIIYDRAQRNKTVEENEIIIRSNEITKKYEVSPHLRRGHFRMLSSEYYKKKKGQIIFIEPTFVKGTAKTLTEKI